MSEAFVALFGRSRVAKSGYVHSLISDLPPMLDRLEVTKMYRRLAAVWVTVRCDRLVSISCKRCMGVSRVWEQ
jgi:hypothetical protein